ncbi:hypothetical protein L484_003907 [Morus notabilis]|uniref:Uncharacterized protein n=1 Tax=Morus notabilis TaxID=981085 RepID=W9SCH5_9ROSA|nr:hypothetical protein L484_003907 [Morus notabilis]
MGFLSPLAKRAPSGRPARQAISSVELPSDTKSDVRHSYYSDNGPSIMPTGLLPSMVARRPHTIINNIYSKLIPTVE